MAVGDSNNFLPVNLPLYKSDLLIHLAERLAGHGAGTLGTVAIDLLQIGLVGTAAATQCAA